MPKHELHKLVVVFQGQLSKKLILHISLLIEIALRKIESTHQCKDWFPIHD